MKWKSVILVTIILMVFVIPYSEAATCSINSLIMTSPTWPMEEDKDDGISTSAQWSYSGSSCPSRFSAKWQYRDPGSGTWDDMGIFANISMNIPRVLCSPFTSTCFVSGTFYGKAYGDLYDIRVAANCVGCGERRAAYYDVLNITDLTAPVIIVDSTESGTTFYNGVAELPIACNDGLNNPDALGIYGNWTGSWDLNVSIQPFIDSMTYQVNTSGVAEGIYTYAAWCNDTYGNFAIGSNKTLIFIDDFGPPPNVTLSAPPNNASYTTTNNVTFYCNVTHEKDFKSASLYGNWSGLGFHKNMTVTSSFNVNQWRDSITYVKNTVTDGTTGSKATELRLQVETLDSDDEIGLAQMCVRQEAGGPPWNVTVNVSRVPDPGSWSSFAGSWGTDTDTWSIQNFTLDPYDSLNQYYCVNITEPLKKHISEADGGYMVIRTELLSSPVENYGSTNFFDGNFDIGTAGPNFWVDNTGLTAYKPYIRITLDSNFTIAQFDVKGVPVGSHAWYCNATNMINQYSVTNETWNFSVTYGDFGCDYSGTGDWTIDVDTHCFQEDKNIVLEAGKGIYVLGNLTLINTNVSGFSFINFTKILPSYPVVRFNMTKKSSLNFTSI